MSAVIHLYSNEGHDESEVWCDENHYSERDADGRFVYPTRDISQATCLRCLSEVVNCGKAAAVRLKELQP